MEGKGLGGGEGGNGGSGGSGGVGDDELLGGGGNGEEL